MKIMFFKQVVYFQYIIFSLISIYCFLIILMIFVSSLIVLSQIKKWFKCYYKIIISLERSINKNKRIIHNFITVIYSFTWRQYTKNIHLYVGVSFLYSISILHSSLIYLILKSILQIMFCNLFSKFLNKAHFIFIHKNASIFWWLNNFLF